MKCPICNSNMEDYGDKTEHYYKCVSCHHVESSVITKNLDELNECPICGEKTNVFFSVDVTYFDCSNKTCGYHNEIVDKRCFL